MTRTKFKCLEVRKTIDGDNVTLEPVIGDSDENEAFFKWTPYGKIELGILNDNVKFTPGKEYYVDFTEIK